MLWLLKYLPTRWHPFLIEHGWLIPALLVFALVLVPLSVLFTTDPYKVTGYVRVDVSSAMDVSTDTGFDRKFTATAPEGHQIIIGTNSFALASSVGDTACLQRRAHISGRVSYVLATPILCAQSD